MAEKKKILYIVEAMGGGVFTYIVDLANELVNKYDMYIAYAVRKQTPKNYKDYFDKRIHLIEVKNFGRAINPTKDIAAFFEVKKIAAEVKPDVIHLHSSKAGAIGRVAFDGKIPMFYEYAAGIVQEIFKSKLNGMSSQRIASHLNELGVLPPNEYKRANGFNYTCGFQAGLNQKWTVVSVNRILKNESYTGTLIQGKRRKINYKVKKSHDVGSENWIRVEDAHDAIISKGEFQQVQQLLELDTRTAPSQTTVYPLSGFLRCADCGQNMIRRTVTKNGKKYQYYHCSTYKNGGGCTPHMINSEKLTESVLAAIRHQVTLLVEAEKVLSNAELASGEQIGMSLLDMCGTRKVGSGGRLTRRQHPA